MAEQAGAPVVSSPLVNEGGGIHVDGEGTVLVTRTVQLDSGRNPDWDEAAVEAELERTLGARRVIWLERGLTRDYDEFGTRGHVDIVATFSSPGTVLVHRQDDPGHPDFEVSRAIAEQLRAERLTVVEVPAPRFTHDEHGPVDYSYINHTLVNGGVVLCGFGEPEADARAASIMAEAYPGRRVELVDARPLFAARRRHPLHHAAAARDVGDRTRHAGFAGAKRDRRGPLRGSPGWVRRLRQASCRAAAKPPAAGVSVGCG